MLALNPSPKVFAPKTRSEASWLQVLSHVDPKFGGIATSVPQLCRATEAGGLHACPVAGFCEESELDQVPVEDRARIEHFPADRLRWMTDGTVRRKFKHLIRSAQGIHIHGLWEAHCAITSNLARSARRPYLISAHGMLDRWALRHKQLKKALYAALIESNNLHRASCLRALTLDEVADYRRVGLRNPVAIVPTGVEVPARVTSNLFWETYPELSGKRIVLFLGRLHQKKGLHLLMEAWARVANREEDVHLVIAGPDSENTLGELEQMRDERELQPKVTFTGMLKGEAKWSALAAASLFVLPSYSEGFSVAVLEALAMGLPVIASFPCHIPEIAKHECGWLIAPELTPLERSLEEFFRLTSSERLWMGGRGRDLVQSKFSWTVVGKQMAQVYDWLLGGVRPDHVEVG